MSSPITNSDDDQSRCSKWSSNRHLTTPSPTIINPLLTHVAPSSLSSSILLDGGASIKRKSAFLPYRPHGTVLTNLQRGNTEATFCPAEVALTFHERAGQGELTAEQVRSELEQRQRRCCSIKCEGSDSNDNEIVKKQKKNSDDDYSGIDFKDQNGLTALHWAAYYGQQATVELLLHAGADVNAQAPELITPLLLAAAGGHHEVVRVLLERGACCTHMDIIGNTALMYAAAGNHPHTCNELLSRNADILMLSNEDEDTAYSLAVENGSHLAQAVIEQYLSALLTL